MILSRERWLVAASVTLLAVIGVALAQSGGVDPGNPATWFLTAAGWGGMVLLIVSFLKVRFATITGLRTVLVSFLVAVGGSFLASTGWFSFVGVNLEGSAGEVLVFGLTAFAAASGGWDAGVSMSAAVSKRLASVRRE